MGEPTVSKRSPDPRWLVLPLPGLVAGGVFGVLVVWVAVLIVAIGGRSTGDALSQGVVLSVVGGLYGAVIGLVCGLPAGLVLTFLVGRDRPGPGVGRRVFVGAAATHAVVLVALMTAVGFGFAGVGTLLLVGSPLVGGLVARWLHVRLANRSRLHDAYAH